MAAFGMALAAPPGTCSQADLTRGLSGLCPGLGAGAVPLNPLGDGSWFSQRVRTCGGTWQ